MQPIRIRFKKEGRARYISHLDLNRVMQRAVRRARIPAWRTQGFNPHIYIVFAVPLSLFYESECEAMDIRLDGEMQVEEIGRRMTEQMPEGITIADVRIPKMKFSDIRSALYNVSLEYADKTPEELKGLVSHVVSNDKIIIEKSTKRRTFEMDIKPFFDKSEITVSGGAVNIKAVLPAGQQENLNPSCFAAAFEKYGGKADFEKVRRIKFFAEDMAEFE